MERRRIGPCTDDRGVAFGFGTAPGMDFDHSGRELVFVEARAHHLHGLQMRVERQINRSFQESDFAGRFDLAERIDLCANVFQLGLWRRELKPIHYPFLVREAAKLLFVRKNGIDRGINLREFFDIRAHFREWLYRGKARGRFDARVGWRDSCAVPLFFGWVFLREKEHFARPIPNIAGGTVFQCGQKDQAGAFFVMASEVVEVFFLREDVGL